MMVPENMVYGSPENVEESWSSTPPSGPRRVIQRSTANSVTEKRSAAAPAAANDEESDEEDETRLKRPRNLPWPPRSVSTEATPTEIEITTKAEKTQEVCHGHHHSRAVTTTAQHSGGPCSSTSQNLGSTVWRAGREEQGVGWSEHLYTEISPLELPSKAPEIYLANSNPRDTSRRSTVD
uniref:Uncharacterized protein n=1 Tax=Fagus sylvatica TaxID=28930 RepID=A0A2N9GZK2_FAGSY